MGVLPIEAGGAQLRAWRKDDLAALVVEANNRAIWRNMTHVFPHPYEKKDGEWWIARCLTQEPPRDLVVAVDGALVGVCGLTLGEGVESHVGTIGYWLGERHWDKGLGTSIVAAYVRYVWNTFSVTRLEAHVFAWNPASVRVLEKNGFRLEGKRRSAICKDGEVTDELIYGLLRVPAGR